MRDSDLALLLDADGRHKPDRIEQRGDNGNFRSHCSCGYVSTRRRTPQLAAEALIHHMRKAGQELLSEVNGVSPFRQERMRA